MQTIDILLLGVSQLRVDEELASNQMSAKLKMSEITLWEISSIRRGEEWELFAPANRGEQGGAWTDGSRSQTKSESAERTAPRCRHEIASFQ